MFYKDSKNFSRENSTKSSCLSVVVSLDTTCVVISLDTTCVVVSLDTTCVVVSLDTTCVVVSHLQQLIRLYILLCFRYELLNIVS